MISPDTDSSGTMQPSIFSLSAHKLGEIGEEARRFRFLAVGVTGPWIFSIVFLAEFRNEYLGSSSAFETGVEICAFRGVWIFRGIEITTWTRLLRRCGSCALSGGVGRASSLSNVEVLRGVREGLNFSSGGFVTG